MHCNPDGRFVIIAWDKATGDQHITLEMLREKYDLAAAEEVLKGLESTMGELRYFFLVPYEEALRIYDCERSQNESSRKNRTNIN